MVQDRGYGHFASDEFYDDYFDADDWYENKNAVETVFEAIADDWIGQSGHTASECYQILGRFLEDYDPEHHVFDDVPDLMTQFEQWYAEQ